MRERLTAAFVILTIVLLFGAGFVRSLILRDLIAQQESAHLQQEAALISRIVVDREETGGTIDQEFLSGLVSSGGRLVYAADRGPTIVVRGSEYTGSDNVGQDLSAIVDIGDGTITMSQSPKVVQEILWRDVGSIVVVFMLIGVLAGLIGFFISRALSAPFRQLAVAAAALGRGRFDLDLPRTRIPEARAIAQALGTSAAQLRDRLRRERDFAEHASHILRTPLTGLRLELEDLTLRDDVPADAREAAARGLASVEEMNAVAGELVELSRSGSLVEGAQLPLVDLATQLAQRWSDRLAARNRTLTASADGDLTLTYTPGPVEHVLDLVLAEVVRRGTGAVTIVFLAQEGGHLRVTVTSAGRLPGSAGELSGPRLEQARGVAESLGGRLMGEDPEAGLEVLLPRR